jgi:hypothetical protein
VRKVKRSLKKGGYQLVVELNPGYADRRARIKMLVYDIPATRQWGLYSELDLDLPIRYPLEAYFADELEQGLEKIRLSIQMDALTLTRALQAHQDPCWDHFHAELKTMGPTLLREFSAEPTGT